MTSNERETAAWDAELQVDNMFRLLGDVFEVNADDEDEWWLDLGYVAIPGVLAV